MPAPAPRPSPAVRPVYAHVASIRIPEFAARPVAEQASLKEGLESVVREALEGVARADRVVLDGDDGLAVVLFGEAAQALDWVSRLAPRTAAASLQVGLNYGPLALTSTGREGTVFGDGVGAALAAAHFAAPERPLVTEDFRRAMQAADPARAEELASAGNFTDSRVRQHTFYWHDPQRGTLRRRREAATRIGLVCVILLLGVLGRDIYQPVATIRHGVVRFDVKPPRGEVMVDGVSRGRLPQVTQVEVTPGRHRIQVRQPGTTNPYDAMVDVRPGEQVTVTHAFARPAAKPDFWQDLKKKFN